MVAPDGSARPVVHAVIGARGGSKGVPGKNIKSLAGHPLLAYSIRACQRSTLVERTILSTDSDEIAAIGVKYGAEVPFRRPAEISGDTAVDYDWVVHVLEWLGENGGPAPDLLVHIRPTTPMRDPALIDEAIRLMIRSPAATALRSVHEMSESAYKMFEMKDGLLKRVGSDSFELDAMNRSRQTLPTTYVPNGYVDVLRTTFIREKGLLHGSRVIPFVTPSVIEVDTHEEFELLEYSIARRPELVTRLFTEAVMMPADSSRV